MFQPAAFFDLQGANTIAGAIGTALFQRERSGIPTEVDVSLLGRRHLDAEPRHHGRPLRRVDAGPRPDHAPRTR